MAVVSTYIASLPGIGAWRESTSLLGYGRGRPRV
jgi:hypothetical protein